VKEIVVQYILQTLREHPEIAIFLTLALGFWFGSTKVGSFIGTVASTLVAGLLVGQLNIHISPVVASTFFTIFLFAVGYSVGPRFVPALKTDGLPQVAFTLIVCAAGFGTAYVAAKIMGYDPAVAAGLLAGATTNSGTLGVATSNLSQLGLDAQQTQSMASLLAIAYAVTYPFGTAGAAWFLSSLAPKLLRVDLKAAAGDYEARMARPGPQLDADLAYRPVVSRSYRLESSALAGRTARELGVALKGAVVTRFRTGGAIREPDAHTPIAQGATLAIAGPVYAVMAAERTLGPEVDDSELLSFPAEQLDIVVTRKDVVGRTVHEFEEQELASYGRPIFLLGITRGGRSVTPSADLKVQRRDVLTVRGVREHVDDLAKSIGYADRPTSKSDVAYMGAGIVIGSLIGAITLHVGGVPLSLSPSVGALLAGIVCGYVRSLYRTFGRIPEPALWAFNNVGLNGFVAVAGLNAGAGLIAGLKTYGIDLFVAGIFVCLVPLVMALYTGKYIFKFHPAILFGACAGARSATASIGAVQEAAQSSVPVIGYTIPYAVSRIVMAIAGIAMLLVMK
jgi:putative transport protein